MLMGMLLLLRQLRINVVLVSTIMGTSHGYCVLDKVNAFVKINGIVVLDSITPRRSGDIVTCYCNRAKNKAELG